MKRAIIIFSAVVVVLIGTILTIPLLFKQEIKRVIDQALADTVNADIIWEDEDFSLTFFSNFPNLSAELNDLGVINRAPFEGDILFVTDALEVEIDPFSLFSDQVRIVGISLENPVVNIRVDKDGNANYDIVISEENSAESGDIPGSYNIGIDHWEINNGMISYEDVSLPMKSELRNVKHWGRGDFNQDEFDVQIYTLADSVMISFDEVTYLNNKRIRIDAILNISDEFSAFQFKENSLAINDFTIGIDGFFKMLADGYEMDLTAFTEDNSFKNLLSIVPGVYSDKFNRIRANGTFDFKASARGKWDDLRIPAFDLTVSTRNSMFQYPDLPTAVDHIDLDLNVSNSDGIIENTIIQLSRFHAEFGDNPIDASLLVQDLRTYEMKGRLSAKWNFEDITTVFPIEEMDINGTGTADISFDGIYDSTQSLMPKINGNVSISNGRVKADDLPYALDKLNLESRLENTTGKMSDFRFTVDPFSLQLDGAPFAMDGVISNLENYTWDVNAQGSLDLKKLSSILKLRDIMLGGQLMADIHTRGNMRALEAEQYEQMPTSGEVTLREFLYHGKEIPVALTVSEAALTFDPANINLLRFKSGLGRSDFSITGSLSNYLGFVLGRDKPLKGNLNISSETIDLNELMADTEGNSAEPDSVLSIMKVPQNIDFTVRANAGEVNLTNMTMTNAKGLLSIRDEKVSLDNFRFDMLGGSFISVGTYSTAGDGKPAFSFGLDVDKVELAKAFNMFELVRVFAPVAGEMKGIVSTEISLSGLLEQDMSPDLGSINADGIIELEQSGLANSQIMEKISSKTNLDLGGDLLLSDLTASVVIENGRLQVEPFKVAIGEFDTEIMGTTSLDGSIAYEIVMQVPAGKLGENLNSFLAQYDVQANDGEFVPVTVGLGGTYAKPEATLLMDEQKEMLENALRQKLTDEADDKAAELLENVEDETTRNILKNVLGTGKKDSVAADSLQIKESYEKIQEEAVDKIKNFFKRKKKADSTSKE
jgi:hypothetical protein